MPNRNEEIIIIIATSTIILVLLSFFFFILNTIRKKQVAYINNLQLIRAEHEKASLQSQLEVQEATFRSISQDIHDNISLTLTLAKLNVNTFMMGRTHLKFDLLNSAVDLIGRSLIDLNNISKSLDSDIISSFGLTRALEMELEKLNQSGQCRFSLESEGLPFRMVDQRELAIFRIIQESCANILKHSGADKAAIMLRFREKILEVGISDDGRGFDQQEMEQRMTLNPRSGLQNIRNRARHLKAEATIASEPGKGTRISITIPKDEHE
jgi:two-component system NarL family sensor kinase